MKLRPFCVGGVWLALLIAGCKADGEAPGQGEASKDAPSVEAESSREPDASDRQAESGEAPKPEAEPEPEPEPIPAPTFADEVGPLVAGEEPSADSGKTAWKHLKAKEYGLAQKHFALAALHDRESYKPAFNLACAAALAGDEPMTRIALTEAIKRDKETVAAKARKDGDLASMRDKDWFEGVLAGEAAAEGAGDGADLDEGLEHEPSMYFVLSSGPNGLGGVTLLYENGFMRWLDGGYRLDVSPDGADYVLRADGTPSIALNLEDADQVKLVDAVGSPYAFDVLSDDEYWVAGVPGVAHYSAGKWTTIGGASFDRKDPPVGVEHDADGTQWVASWSSVYRVDGDSLAVVAVPGQARNLSLIAQGGALYLARGTDVLVLESGAWKVVSGTSTSDPVVSVAIQGDGAIVQGLASGGLRRVKDGSVETLALPDVDSMSCVGTDAARRTWVATPQGVFVVRPDFSGVLRHYATGSIEELAAAEGNDVVLQFLAQGGPVQLPPSTKERGVVIGRLMYKGKPLAERYFDMCEDPARKNSEMGSMGTPCEMSEPSWSTKTDSEGRFRLTGVDAKLYDFAAFVPDNKIGATKDSPCCFDLPDEGTLNLGDVVLK